MKATLIKKLLCATAISLTPFLAFAGGTNSDNGASTGYKNAPDRSTQQGDMGQGVGTDSTSSPDGKMSDSDLKSKVKEALKNDAQLQKLDIDVSVDNGVAKLSGNVSDVRFKARAAKVASNVQGVKTVQNDLSIKKN